MLYLIFGKDNFRVQEKLAQIRGKFIKKTGSDLNIIEFDEKAQIEQIKNAFQFGGLLAEQKLIIFKNFSTIAPAAIQKELAKLLNKIPKAVHLVFIEGELKSNSLVRKIKTQGKAWQFELLSYYELLNWIKKRVEDKKRRIDPEAVKTLAFYIGNNLARTDNEIEKLITYKGQKTIMAEDVRLLVKPEFSPGIFKLIDNIAAKDLKKSQNILQQLLDAGENPLYIHSMIVYQFRNLIIIKSLSNLGSAEIRKKTKLHPFVIQKSQQQIRNFSFENLKRIYAKLLDGEIAIKTGKIEPRLALELLVTALLG